MKQSINVFWFRRDLRLIDNTALFHALNSGFKVLPIFIFDTNILDKLSDKSDRRVSFIYQQLKHINYILQQQNSSFYILYGTPLSSFEELCNKFNIEKVFANHDYEPYAIERDTQIHDFLLQKNIPFITNKDQVIFEKSEVM